jgi:hypothetical protein
VFEIGVRCIAQVRHFVGELLAGADEVEMSGQCLMFKIVGLVGRVVGYSYKWTVWTLKYLVQDWRR